MFEPVGCSCFSLISSCLASACFSAKNIPLPYLSNSNPSSIKVIIFGKRTDPHLVLVQLLAPRFQHVDFHSVSINLQNPRNKPNPPNPLHSTRPRRLQTPILFPPTHHLLPNPPHSPAHNLHRSAVSLKTPGFPSPSIIISSHTISPNIYIALLPPPKSFKTTSLTHPPSPPQTPTPPRPPLCGLKSRSLLLHPLPRPP